MLNTTYMSGITAGAGPMRSESQPEPTFMNAAVASASDSMSPIAATGAPSTLARKSGSTG